MESKDKRKQGDRNRVLGEELGNPDATLSCDLGSAAYTS